MVVTSGVGSVIDGCAGLIHKRAYTTYSRIPETHKRWIDIDDCVQEGLIAAWLCAQTWNPKLGSSFSTYLWNGLKHHFDRQFHTPLRQLKRATLLVELDAPLQDEEGSLAHTRSVQITAHVVHPLYITEAVDQFLQLCAELSTDAVKILSKGILCGAWTGRGKRPDNEQEIFTEIRTTSLRIGIHMEKISVLYRDKKAHKLALTHMSRFVSIGLGIEADAKILECVDCRGQFYLSDIQARRYFVETMTCLGCYKRLRKLPDSESCFGKTQLFDSSSAECNTHCEDRKVCAEFVKETNSMAPEEDDLNDVDFDDLEEGDESLGEEDESDDEEEEEEVEVKTKAKPAAKKTAPAKKAAVAETKPKAEKAKAAKAAEPATKKKASDEPEPPEEFGGSWPFKKGSMMRKMIQLCVQPGGIKATDLEKKLEAAGVKPKIQFMVLRRGFPGNNSHSWKLNEDGGIFKLTNVKFHGKKAAAGKKAAKAVAKAKPAPEKKKAKASK